MLACRTAQRFFLRKPIFAVDYAYCIRNNCGIMNAYPDQSHQNAWRAAEGDDADKIHDLLIDHETELNRFIEFCILEDENAAQRAYCNCEGLELQLDALDCDKGAYRAVEDVDLELQAGAEQPIPEEIQ